MNLVSLIASPGFASQLASKSLLLALLDARFSSREKVLEESGSEKFISPSPVELSPALVSQGLLISLGRRHTRRSANQDNGLFAS